MPDDGRIRRVAVFGGSGFLGSEIVDRLAADGMSVRVAVRHPDKAKPNSPKQNSNIEPVYADVRDETSVALALDGCDAAVNAVGLYVERGAATFEAVHELGALNVAHQCAVRELPRLVHISGIGVDLRSSSKYVRARAKGELLVRDVFPPATVFRPSVMFGPRDRFINTLAGIIRRAPVLPLFDEGQTKLQTVYVGDVAQGARNALRDRKAAGLAYELGGPETLTYRALLERLMDRMEKRRLLMPMPFLAWKTIAAILSVLPEPPITRDQIVLMERDNVVGKRARTLRHLRVSPTALDKILPKYDL